MRLADANNYAQFSSSCNPNLIASASHETMRLAKVGG